jgi:hypothetical protein
MISITAELEEPRSHCHTDLVAFRRQGESGTIALGDQRGLVPDQREARWLGAVCTKMNDVADREKECSS